MMFAGILPDLIKTLLREFLSVLWEQSLFLLTGRKMPSSQHLAWTETQTANETFSCWR